jgi:hypothetical protein
LSWDPIAVGSAKWWVCDGCKSLNDVPAKKCYNCRTKRPDKPTLIDDSYSEVKTKGRVSVSVDRSMVAALVAPDPSETARKSSFDDMPALVHGGVPGNDGTDTATLMREPPKRSIAVIGERAWARQDRRAGSTGALPAGNALPMGQMPPMRGSTQRHGVPPPLARSVPPPPPGSLPLPPPPPPLGRQQLPRLDEDLADTDVPEPRPDPERPHEDTPEREPAQAGVDDRNADDGTADNGTADNGDADDRIAYEGNADDE